MLGIGVIARRSVSDSIDFFLSGRSLPAWVTGLAFISANLGAVEIMGMSANGAKYGLPTVHYFWVGAIPAMLFLGVVMMPFYYGSKVRSVPEFMFRRFGTGAHLVNAISFAVAQLLIAGVNLYLLGSIVHALLGWPLWVALIVAALIVLSYITLGGLSAAIYNEVLQFFVIVASLLPLTLIGLHRVGGYGGLKDKITAFAEPPRLAPRSRRPPSSSSPGRGRPCPASTRGFWSVIGIVFGLGFVLSFGYWTTNFVEVQRAMASEVDLRGPQDADHRRLPQDVRAVPRHPPRHGRGRAGAGDHGPQERRAPRRRRSRRGREVQRRAAPADARRAAERPAGSGDRRPARGVHGRHGGQHLGLQHGLQLRPVAALHPQGPQRRLLPADRPAGHRGGDGHRDLHGARSPSSFSNIMDYLQTLFGFFNAPLFATFILGMFWKRMTADRRLGGPGLRHPVGRDRGLPERGRVRLGEPGGHPARRSGGSFVAASAAFVVDIILSVVVTLVTKPKPASELKGLVYSETPREDLVDPEEAPCPWYQRTLPLAGIALVMVLILNFAF